MKLIKVSLSPIQKICLAGLFIALTTILQKVVAINYLAFAPFVRISLGGPALIIFSSILLGPIYGLFVGMASDILGYFFFDPRNNSFFPTITAIYAVLGFVSYFIFSFVFSFKNRKTMTVIEIVTMAIIWAVVSLFIILSNQITLFKNTYDVTLLSKILIPAILGLIFVGIIIISIVIKPKDDSVFVSPLHICFGSFICDFFIIVLFGSLMKAVAFGFATFLAIILCQAMVMFVNVLLDTLFISAFQRLTKKYYLEV